jgi:4-amino-4-deoxychorismate lyase
MSGAWWINDVPAHLVEVTDRGLAYGDGLFETIAVDQGSPRLLELHLDRLLAGAGRLGLPAPDRIWLADTARSRVTGQGNAVLKLLLTRGPAGRGYAPPRTATPTLAMGLLPRELAPPAHYRDGITAGLSGVPASLSPALAGLKTLGRLEQVLAAAERQAAGFAESLMCDPDGRLVSGTMSNLFLVRAGMLLTPLLDRSGVHGVMRRLVLELAPGLGLEVREQRLPAAVLEEADEIFVCNALIGLWPVSAIGRWRRTPGPVTRRIAAALAARGVVECAAAC